MLNLSFRLYPDTRNTYTVTPIRTYTMAEGPCREFTLDAQIGGKTAQIYGAACRQSDGSWKVVK
jgi:surface antigen